MKRNIKATIVAGLFAGIAISACAKRHAREACEDYFDTIEECGSEIPALTVDCSGVSGKDRDFWECMADWAADGCVDESDC